MILNLIRSTCRNAFKYGPAIPGYYSYFSSTAAKGSLERSGLRLRLKAFARSLEDYSVAAKCTIVAIKYGILALIFVGGVTTYHWGSRATKRRMTKRLRNGSDRKPMRSFEWKIDRSDTIESIQKLLFESDPDNGKIGVILGPEGSGKSFAVIEAYSNTPGPKHILYQEVYQTSEFARQLANAANIPLSRNIFDSIFNGLGLDSQFYKYPDDPIQAITYVMNKVAKRSKEEMEWLESQFYIYLDDPFHYNYPDDRILITYVMNKVAKEEMEQNGQLKHLPCFVIDAAEILAIYDTDMFDALLLLAKHYIDFKKLRIVLVDSNGIALSKINRSLKHPVVDIVEVKDVTDENAEEYLLKRTNMSNNLAKQLVGLIGGRLLHLTYAVDAYQNLDSDQNEDLAYESIKEHLFVKVIAPVNNVIADNIALSELIVKCIISHDSKPLFPSELKMYLKSNLKDKYPTEAQKVIDALVVANLLKYNDPAEAQKVIDALVNTNLLKYNEVIDALVKANLLRYNAEEKLVWHSRFVEAQMKIQYPIGDSDQETS